MHPDGYPRTFSRLIPGGNESMLWVIKGKLSRLTQGVPTLQIEWILIIMQEFVVGLWLTWIHLLGRVARVIIRYREVAKAATTNEPKEEF